MAASLGAGFVPVRKPGKLPWEIERQEYELEYGTDLLEIHRDAVRPGERVLIVDDVLATGGTLPAGTRSRIVTDASMTARPMRQNWPDVPLSRNGVARLIPTAAGPTSGCWCYWKPSAAA